MEPNVILQRIRTYRKLCRRVVFHRSRLEKFRAELVALRNAGASYPELTIWLRQEKRIKMAHTTIMRYLKQLPEVC